MFGIIALALVLVVILLKVVNTSLKVGFGITGFAVKLLFSKPVMLGIIAFVALQMVGVV